MMDYFYEIDLNWTSGRTSSLHVHGLPELEVEFPVELPQPNKKKWTPEHLLAAAVSSGFMNYFLDLSEQTKLKIISYTSQSFVKLRKQNDRYVISEILIRPTIQLISDLNTTQAYSLIEKAQNTYYLKEDLRINIEIHPQFEYLNRDEILKM